MVRIDQILSRKESWMERLLGKLGVSDRVISYFFDRRLSEAALLQRELMINDREYPGWDLDARRAALRSALNRDVDRSHLVRVYGEELVCEQEAVLAGDNGRLEAAGG